MSLWVEWEGGGAVSGRLIAGGRHNTWLGWPQAVLGLWDLGIETQRSEGCSFGVERGGRDIGRTQGSAVNGSPGCCRMVMLLTKHCTPLRLLQCSYLLWRYSTATHIPTHTPTPTLPLCCAAAGDDGSRAAQGGDRQDLPAGRGGRSTCAVRGWPCARQDPDPGGR